MIGSFKKFAAVALSTVIITTAMPMNSVSAATGINVNSHTAA